MERGEASSATETSPKAREHPPIDEAIALIISGQTNAENVATLDTLTTAQLLSYTSDGLDPLTVLNPVSHSLAYLYFIGARSKDATASNGKHLFEMLSHFIQVFDPEQIQTAPTRFTIIGKALLHLAKVLKQPLLPLQSFKTAIERFSFNQPTLTSLHAPFIRACILAKQYRFPLDLLNRDIEILDTTKNDINIQRFLEYYYYGALVYIGNLNYDRALDFLSIVISVPTQKAISAIQVAAYKNFVLASLIVDGQVRTLPKYTAQGVEKVCRTHASAYLSLVKAFTDTNISMFHDVASKHSGIFESNKHMGLVKQCLQSLRRKIIKELTNVYITVGLNEMAEKIGGVTARELELILIEMVNQKQVSATMSITEQHVKMVHFIDQTDKNEINLEDRIFSIAAVNERVSFMNKLEGLNRDFQTKYMTLSANGGQLASASYDEDFDISVDDDNKAFS
ncbi:COP9 signalosome complex subunit 3 [Mucor ambiguus]|uniref:COP9 signalosome complex subunit 3 n=1 Tax=Mucor ambiguus TaxID=91626 RepID=A0A0C9N4D7_9FUNG|nr:COP9 signalosome complex subunit 3 [Mucor ambiguus]